LADGVEIDVQTILTGRGCIIGQSGSGKSFLVGVIAEELCKSNLPFCIIDTEGEYSSLKSMFNVIVVGGNNKDIDLDTDYSKLFDMSIANDLPVVLDVSDSVDKTEAVSKAIGALYDLENKIRRPYLVLIEEADKFAPQTASKKANILEEISVRGRKRGIGLLIATQRPANISKNVLSQCSYGFIGKLTIENDLNSIRILFRDRDTLVNITKLTVGEFVTFGLDRTEKFRVKPRLVKHMGTTPLIDDDRPVNDKINKIIKELKGGGKSEIPKKKGEFVSMPIYAIPVSFTMNDAKEYAEKIAKRKFVIFGDATETITSIDVEYLPLGLCSLRIPTGHKNEYLEYYTLINDKCELVKLDKKIKFLGPEDTKEPTNKTYKPYLKKGDLPSEKIDAEKDYVIKRPINEKKSTACIKNFFPTAILTEFKVIHIPMYKITLKKDNKVRVFVIDGIYGKEIILN
jgi:uncharacterized protein